MLINIVFWQVARCVDHQTDLHCFLPLANEAIVLLCACAGIILRSVQRHYWCTVRGHTNGFVAGKKGQTAWPVE